MKKLVVGIAILICFARADAEEGSMTNVAGEAPVVTGTQSEFFIIPPAKDQEVLSLAEGLRMATEKNHVIRIALKNRDIASADVGVAYSRLLPSLDAALSQTLLAYQPGVFLGSQAVAVRTAEKSSLSYGISFSQTLYDFGARRSLYGASKTALDSTKLDAERIRNSVALDFITVYFDLLESEKLLLVARKEVESLKSHLAVAQSLYDEGAITRNDLLQASVRLSDARQRLITAGNLRIFISSRLNNILSRPLDDAVKVIDPADSPVMTTSLDEAWRRAEAQRRELKIIDNEVSIANLEETAKKSGYYPTFFAQGAYNYAENRFQIHEDNWSFVIGLNLNLFSGGATAAEVSKARYRREQLIEQWKRVLDEVKLEVKRNYLEIANAREKIQVTKDAVLQAEENLRINRVRYEEGVGTATDVLDAITLLTTAETNYYRASYELRRAEAGLLYSMGSDLAAEYR